MFFEVSLTISMSMRLFSEKLIVPLILLAIPVMLSIDVAASPWRSDCVKWPTNLNSSNADKITGDECQITAVQAQLSGTNGYLHTYQFRDGTRIRVFIPEANLRLDRSYPIFFSIGDNAWSRGQRTESDLPHQCDSYQCYWMTVRDADGNIIVAEGFSQKC